MTATRMLRYEETAPVPGDYNRLRRDAGWPKMDPTVSASSLKRSCFAVTAYDGSELLGMGRAVGDFGLCFYIQDVVVSGSHQRRGVGDSIMRRLMKFISEHAVEHTYVGLMSAAGREPFSQRYGFTSRPTETLGCGMTVFWRDSGSRAESKKEGATPRVPTNPES